MAVSKKKSDLFVLPGYDSRSAIDPELAKTYCDKYMVIIHYCSDFKQYNKVRHLPFFKWKNKDHAKQLAYVEQHEDTVKFNKHLMHNLPANKKHLLGDPGAP